MQKRSDLIADGVLIFFLCGVAIAQPLYDVLSRGAEFFVARGSDPVEILFMVAVLSLLIPGCLLAAEVLIGLLSQQARRALHCVVTSALFAALFLPLLKHITYLTNIATLSTAGTAGIVCGLAFFRWRLLRGRYFMVSASILATLLPLWFLFATPVRDLIIQNRSVSGISSREAPRLKTPVFLIILDELATTTLMNERREIDGELFPSLHALAAESTWYRNATTVADATTHAVPAILTGNYPNQKLLPTASAYPENLFTLLGKENDMVVYESTTELCPAELCGHNDRGEQLSTRLRSLFSDLAITYAHVILPGVLAEKMLPPISATWHDFAQPADDTDGPRSTEEVKVATRVAQIRNFTCAIQPPGRPALYYLHASLPHFPWRYTPTGKHYAFGPATRSLGLSNEEWSADTWRATQGFQRHVLQTMFVDKLISELFSKLKELKLYDRSLIILTSDHGLSFKAGDSRRKLTATNYKDIMPVPLLVKRPHQKRGATNDHNVETIDILPTIADTQKFHIPWQMDGLPLDDATASSRNHKTIYSKASGRQSFNAQLNEKYDTLRWKTAITGPDVDPIKLYRIGPHDPYKVLIGQQAPDRHEPTARWKGDLDLPKLFDDIIMENPVIPALVSGRIRTEETHTSHHHLAIAVNGTIQAITRTYQEDTATRFAAMIPEASLRRGRNQVEIFLIHDGVGKAPRLSRVPTGETPYTLEQTADSEVIHSADGKSFPVEAGRIKGRVRRGGVRKEIIVFRGWAAHAEESEPLAAVLVFENNRFFFSGTTGGNQRTPEDGPAAKGSGFKFLIPKSAILNIETGNIRFFGITHRGDASELRYSRNFQWRGKNRRPTDRTKTVPR